MPDQYLEQSLLQLIYILKNNRKVAVLSEKEYESLKITQDFYLVNREKEVSLEGYASKEEIISLIDRLKDELRD